MTTKYFKTLNRAEVFKIEGRDLVRGKLSISYPENRYQEITEIEYNNLITRRTGRSTRAINFFIEELFERGETIVVDHHGTPLAHKDLLFRVLKRLESEHLGAYKSIEVKGLTIKFKQEN